MIYKDMPTKKNTRLYQDIDLDFEPHPLTGDVTVKQNEDAIKRAVRNLVLYNQYEKPFDPKFGSSIREMLFENVQTSTAMGIEKRIQFLLEQNEPRINLIGVKANPDEENSSYEIIITFSTLNVLDPITTTIYLQRIR